MATLGGIDRQPGDDPTDEEDRPYCRTHPLGCPEPGKPAVLPPVAYRVESVSWAMPPVDAPVPTAHERIRQEVRHRRRSRGR